MAYRPHRTYLRFRDVPVKGRSPTSVGRYMDFLSSLELQSKHLPDQPAVTETQDVYKSLEIEE